MVLVVLATAVLIIMLFRGPQTRKTPPRDERVEPPQPSPPPVVRPVPPPRRRFPPPLVQPIAKAEPAPPMAAVPVAKPVIPVVTSARKPSPAAMELFNLLKNRHSLRAAVLLHEILDPPLCRRRR
jgi:hypothetical protein